jgi:hypothetical protein
MFCSAGWAVPLALGWVVATLAVVFVRCAGFLEAAGEVLPRPKEVFPFIWKLMEASLAAPA